MPAAVKAAYGTTATLHDVQWPDEVNLAEFEAFGDVIGNGAYWAATTLKPSGTLRTVGMLVSSL